MRRSTPIVPADPSYAEAEKHAADLLEQGKVQRTYNASQRKRARKDESLADKRMTIDDVHTSLNFTTYTEGRTRCCKAKNCTR